MKAIVITHPGDPSVLKFQSVPEPVPAKGDLLVEVNAFGLNRADILQRRGLYPPPPGTREDILGLEVSGVVVQNNGAPGDFTVGTRIMALLPGEGYAERVVVPASQALPIPENLSFEEAAGIPEVFLTAFDAVFLQLKTGCGQTLLIHAVASGVGTAALQLAKVSGLRTLGTSGSREKLERAKELGLELALDYREGQIRARALAFTGGAGVDSILDLVGAAHWAENIALLRPQGRLIVVGLVSGRKVEVDLGEILRKRLTIIGTALRSRSIAEKALLVQLFRERVLPLFRNGTIRPVIDQVYDWKDVGAAHRRMEENQNFGKIVLRIT